MSNALEIEDGSEVEEIEDTEDVVNDDDRPTNKTYYIGCQAVYSNCFNARGVKVRGSGNNSTQCMSCCSLLFSFAIFVLMRIFMSGPLDRGGRVVVHPSNDKQPTLAYTNEGASSFNSSQSVSKLPRSQTLNLIYWYPISGCIGSIISISR